MKKNILITGVAGLLGSRLADWIIENKGDEYQVIGVDDLSGGFEENIHPDVKFWQMDLVNHPGLAFYPEEHGVPSYEELIYISNTKNRKNPIFDKFFKAIQKATLTIVNDPKSTWKDFSSFRKGLDDELNKRAYKDTLSRFALRPQAHDLNTYRQFGNFLKEKGIIQKTLQVETFAKP